MNATVALDRLAMRARPQGTPVMHQQIYITRLYHPPWILEEATVLSHESTMIGTIGLPEPGEPPLAHFARNQNVDIWAPVPI